MGTYYTDFGVDEAVTIKEVNERLADLDAGIVAVAGGADLSAALLEERQATTVDGGGSTATTWNDRGTLTEVVDADSIVTVSTNTFTPIAGTYLVFVEAVCAEGGENRIRLYNSTGASAVKEGLNADSPTSGASTLASLFYIITADGATAYKIQHYTELTKATSGLGVAVGDGSNEVYCQILLVKI